MTQVHKIESDRERVLNRYPVSRETTARLDLLVSELKRWQTIKNLVGPATLDHVWTRHIADSLQLLTCVALDSAKPAQWIDLGSGAGFPGLVLAIAAHEHKSLAMNLVESNGRKCAFLRHIVRETGISAQVFESRIERVVPEFIGKADIISARALASLSSLLELSKELLRSGAIGVFPKGQDWENELTEARKYWRIDAEVLPSQVDVNGRILIIRDLRESEAHHG